MKSAPSSAAFSISVGVIVPGIVIASRDLPAAIISGMRAGDTRKRAPAMSESSACAPVRTVPAPTIAPCAANSSSVASAAISSYASGTVSVISTRRTPARAIARAASSAASAVAVRTTATRRSSEKMRTRSRRSTGGRCVTAMTRWYDRRDETSALDEEHSRGRAVGAADLHGRAHELVGAGLHRAQVQAFDDDDTGAEERVVGRVPGLLGALRLDGQVVDPDKPYGVLDTPARRGRADRR